MTKQQRIQEVMDVFEIDDSAKATSLLDAVDNAETVAAKLKALAKVDPWVFDFLREDRMEGIEELFSDVAAEMRRLNSILQHITKAVYSGLEMEDFTAAEHRFIFTDMEEVLTVVIRPALVDLSDMGGGPGTGPPEPVQGQVAHFDFQTVRRELAAIEELKPREGWDEIDISYWNPDRGDRPPQDESDSLFVIESARIGPYPFSVEIYDDRPFEDAEVYDMDIFATEEETDNA